MAGSSATMSGAVNAMSPMAIAWGAKSSVPGPLRNRIEIVSSGLPKLTVVFPSAKAPIVVSLVTPGCLGELAFSAGLLISSPTAPPVIVTEFAPTTSWLKVPSGGASPPAVISVIGVPPELADMTT